MVGAWVGEVVGLSVGEPVGLELGDAVGASVGDVVGFCVQIQTISKVKNIKSMCVSNRKNDCTFVGDAVGLSVGELVGSCVGDCVGDPDVIMRMNALSSPSSAYVPADSEA